MLPASRQRKTEFTGAGPGLDSPSAARTKPRFSHKAFPGSRLPLGDNGRDFLQFFARCAHVQGLNERGRGCDVENFFPRDGFPFAVILTLHFNIAIARCHLKWSATFVIEIRAPNTANFLRLTVPPYCGVIAQFVSTCRGYAKFLG